MIFRPVSKILRAITCWLVLFPCNVGAQSWLDTFTPDSDLNYSLQSDLNGKKIRHITIRMQDIFEDPSNLLFRQANSLKIETRAEVIRAELLFEEGDLYDEFRVRESERSLRRLRYLRRTKITATPDGDEVDILVASQDTWTLIPQLSFSSGDGSDRMAIGMSESDLLGYGKRVEVLYDEEDGRTSLSGVFDAHRLYGTNLDFLLGYLDRTDGEKIQFSTGRPFRTLLDTYSWTTSAELSDTIGRLFLGGDERFIFRQEITDLSFRFTVARGNPEVSRRRYTFGYQFSEISFSEAQADDFEDLDLDPEELNQDPSQLASDRRFSGPVLSYESIDPEYISMNYIDRFSRVEDYNIGLSYSGSLHYAPQFFGSDVSALRVTGNIGRGVLFSTEAFLRGEVGISSRITDHGFENSVLRTELKYFNVLGARHLFGLYTGKHTFASTLFFDFGADLDKDREFLLGGDNALRGYEARTFPGERRVALILEDRIHFVENVIDLLNIGGAAFIEAGGASDGSIKDLFADKIYSDVGVGLRVGFPRSSGERVLRFDVAFPLRDGIDGSEAFDPRFIVSGGQIFSGRTRTEIVGSERASLDVGFDR